MSFTIKKILYSTSPLWKNNVNSVGELNAKDSERRRQYSNTAFQEACANIINAKPNYGHAVYNNVNNKD